MSTSRREEVFALAPQERPRLAAEFIESLVAAGEDEAERAWEDEIARREAELDQGEVETMDWLTVRRSVLGGSDRDGAGDA